VNDPAGERLPADDLPGADWADRRHLVVSRRLALGEGMPAWANGLMRLRNLLGRAVGLKGAGRGAKSGGEASIGGFPIVSETPTKLVLGFNDWHLDFRIVVETNAVPGGTDISLTTLVKRKNWFGRAYIFLITPFHVLIVNRSLAGIAASVS
jgi:hypothetical protein